MLVLPGLLVLVSGARENRLSREHETTAGAKSGDGVEHFHPARRGPRVVEPGSDDAIDEVLTSYLHKTHETCSRNSRRFRIVKPRVSSAGASTRGFGRVVDDGQLVGSGAPLRSYISVVQQRLFVGAERLLSGEPASRLAGPPTSPQKRVRRVGHAGRPCKPTRRGCSRALGSCSLDPACFAGSPRTSTDDEGRRSGTKRSPSREGIPANGDELPSAALTTRCPALCRKYGSERLAGGMVAGAAGAESGNCRRGRTKRRQTPARCERQSSTCGANRRRRGSAERAVARRGRGGHESRG